MIDDDVLPFYLGDDGRRRVPLAYRRYHDRAEFIRALVRHVFADARHLGSRRR